MKKRKYKPGTEKPSMVSEPFAPKSPKGDFSSPPFGGPGGSEGPLTFEKVWKMFQETSEQMKETERLMKESSQETDRKFHETDRQFKETDKKIKELAELFTGQWGKLVELLVAPGCMKLFQERGIKILQCFPNFTVQKNGRQMEIDLMLVNDTELVVVEIKKATLAFAKRFGKARGEGLVKITNPQQFAPKAF